MASTHTSRKVSTQTANGKTIKTTVITETKVFPDGREEVNTTTEVEEQGAEGVSKERTGRLDGSFIPIRMNVLPFSILLPNINMYSKSETATVVYNKYSVLR